MIWPQKRIDGNRMMKKVSKDELIVSEVWVDRVRDRSIV